MIDHHPAYTREWILAVWSRPGCTVFGSGFGRSRPVRQMCQEMARKHQPEGQAIHVVGKAYESCYAPVQEELEVIGWRAALAAARSLRSRCAYVRLYDLQLGRASQAYHAADVGDG